LKRNLKVVEKQSESLPYIVLPPDNSIPDDGKVLRQQTNGFEMPELISTPTIHPATITHRSQAPTASPHGASPFPSHIRTSREKPININIIMPTQHTHNTATHTQKPLPLFNPTLSGNVQQQSHDNYTTIDVNLNIGEDETTPQQKQPIVVQVAPTTPVPRTVIPPAQQLLAAIAANLPRQPNAVTNANQIPLGFPQTALRGLVNNGISSNYPLIGININRPIPNINTNFPAVGVNNNPPVSGIINNIPVGNMNTNFPVTGINANLPGTNANYPVSGLNNINSIPLFGVNNNVPGTGPNFVPGINNNIPLAGANGGLSNGIVSNFPTVGVNNFPGTGLANYPGNTNNLNPGIGNNIQGYPTTDPNLLQHLSSVISNSIKSSMALSQPEIIAAALQRLAAQTQSANQPEQLLSNALTQALTRAVGQNGEISQEQKLVNSLATALNMLNNRGRENGPSGMASYPSQFPSQTPFKVEVVNMPQRFDQQPQQNQVPLFPPTSTVPGNKFMDEEVGKLAASTLGKAMATALINTAKTIVTGVQRDKILKTKDLKTVEGNLAKFLKVKVFGRFPKLKCRSGQGHKPLRRTFLGIHRCSGCCCCCSN